MVSNSNSALVNTSVDNGTDQLTLDYQADQSGSADITIRAEDGGGLTVDEVFTVTVSNLAPVFNSSNSASFAENDTGTGRDVYADNGGAARTTAALRTRSVVGRTTATSASTAVPVPSFKYSPHPLLGDIDAGAHVALGRRDAAVAHERLGDDRHAAPAVVAG